MSNSTTSTQTSSLHLQPVWQSLVESYSPQALEFVGTLIIQFVAFWIPCAIYQFLDVLFPAFSHHHKIQPAPKQPSAPELWYCFLIVLRNQVFSTALHIALLAGLTPFGHTSSFRIGPSLPGPLEIVRDIAICFAIREVMFYYSHRLLHLPRFYAPVHKFHHRFVAPVAMASEFAHPLEHLLSNMLPVSMPPQLIGAHIITAWLFLVFVLLETTAVHSGYDFAGNLAGMHDLHHEAFMINFGTNGILDRFHGTYKRKAPKGEKKQ